MSKVLETLAALMTATGLASNDVAESFVGTLDQPTAERLLDSLRANSIGETPNLPEGRGGFLAGLRLTLDAFRATQKAALEGNPKELTKEQRLEVIQQYDESVAQSNMALVEGLRQILSATRAKRKADLSSWAVELSDEDKAVAIASLDGEQKIREEEALRTLKSALDKGRSTAKAIVKRHKNHS